MARKYWLDYPGTQGKGIPLGLPFWRVVSDAGQKKECDVYNTFCSSFFKHTL